MNTRLTVGVIISIVILIYLTYRVCACEPVSNKPPISFWKPSGRRYKLTIRAPVTCQYGIKIESTKSRLDHYRELIEKYHPYIDLKFADNSIGATEFEFTDGINKVIYTWGCPGTYHSDRAFNDIFIKKSLEELDDLRDRDIKGSVKFM